MEVMPRRFRPTCLVFGRPDLKSISRHLLLVHSLSSGERKPYLKQAKVLSWHPYTYLPRGEKPSEGEQETRKIKMTTTLGVEKKLNDLIKRRKKMTNAPLRTAASEPGDNRRQKRRKSN